MSGDITQTGTGMTWKQLMKIAKNVWIMFIEGLYFEKLQSNKILSTPNLTS